MDKPILLVDDEQANIFTLQFILRNNGYQTESCQSGTEALELVRSGDYALVLLDVMMPGMDGHQTCREIRSTVEDVPVILVTALSQSQDLKEGFDAGAIDYIRKPIDEVELLARVRNTLRIKKSEDQTKSLYSAIMQDLEVASNTQSYMLPKQFVLEDRLIFSSGYTPSTKIGGDLFDIIKISEGKYFVYISDISGHGIQAALLMSAVKSIIHLTVESEGAAAGAADLLNRINSVLSDGLFRKNYMTMLAGIVDLAENTFRYFNAGHPPIICYDSKSEKAEVLESDGSVPIGWGAGIEYSPQEEGCVELDANKTIVLYTDGIIECERLGGEQLGIEGLAGILEEAFERRSCLLTPHQVKEFLTHNGYDITKDDFSMLVFQRTYETDKRLFLDIRQISDETRRQNKTHGRGIPLLSGVGPAGSACEQKIIEWTGDAELAAETEIVINEYLNNIIIHGLQSKNDSLLVELSLDETVRIRFLDQGLAWEPAMTCGQGGELFGNENGYTESGRGMKMIQHLASSFQYNRYDRINETIIEMQRE